MHTEKLKEIVEEVLATDVTDYALADSLGYKNQYSIKKLRSGEGKIEKLSLQKLAEFERYYRDMRGGE